MQKRNIYRADVTKGVLLFLAGLLWLCVGTMLIVLAVSWLWETANVNRYLFVGAGVVLALILSTVRYARFLLKEIRGRERSSLGR